jgi:alpha-D-ribose 1-methylphosphonate 5-triphosphate synthase subunit PhnH
MNGFSTVPGFANPVDDAQAVFRAVLAAFSRPGIPVFLASRNLPPPVPGLSQNLLALALAFCDGDTPLWLDAATDTPEARHHLRFHCAAPFAAEPSGASFIFISRPEDMPRLSAFNSGRADFPDRSATLVINAALAGARAADMELSGPGVKGSDRGSWQRFRVSGLPAWFWKDWDENRAAYPLGVDIVFADVETSGSGGPSVTLLGLPRTVRVRQAGGPPPVPALKGHAACMSL